MFGINLLGRYFMYIKKSNGPKRDLGGTPALIITQWEF